LAQYDEEIDGKKKKRFVLDGSGNSADINAHQEEVVEKLKAKLIINLDIPSQYS
jgi:U4/U6.U5 tri-snRNP-associated protein 1